MGSVPELPGCHTQAKTFDGLMERVKEAFELYLEVEPAPDLFPALIFLMITNSLMILSAVLLW